MSSFISVLPMDDTWRHLRCLWGLGGTREGTGLAPEDRQMVKEPWPGPSPPPTLHVSPDSSAMVQDRQT